MLGAVRRTYLS
uniref:Uncharacterized protein n=1 Tax=Anguilla anguilla TaxID=7936 RepID=A0A0E9PSN4_ANGAN